METVKLPEVHRAGGLIGAELSGLDLTREYPDETYDAILQAWAEYGVIFFRGQHLDAAQRDAFAARLGEIRVRQELRKEPDQTKAIGEGWHTDMTCLDEPPKATILFCEEVPPWGGDTQWAAMGPVFEALSAGLRQTLLGLNAIHANVRKLGYSYAQTDPPEPSVSEYDAAQGPVHPVVRLIPETGRRVLYVNPEFTMRFEGWTRRESLPLLKYLFDFGPRPEFVTRFRWAPGSIAMWDNRQTWHFAVNDYQGQRRVMHRILLAGSKPIPAALPASGALPAPRPPARPRPPPRPRPGSSGFSALSGFGGAMTPLNPLNKQKPDERSQGPAGAGSLCGIPAPRFPRVPPLPRPGPRARRLRRGPRPPAPGAASPPAGAFTGPAAPPVA